MHVLIEAHDLHERGVVVRIALVNGLNPFHELLTPCLQGEHGVQVAAGEALPLLPGDLEDAGESVAGRLTRGGPLQTLPPFSARAVQPSLNSRKTRIAPSIRSGSRLRLAWVKVCST